MPSAVASVDSSGQGIDWPGWELVGGVWVPDESDAHLTSGLTVQITSLRVVPFSLEQVRCCGLDPSSFKVLVAKGVNAPIAAYEEVCNTMIRVNTPGSTTADVTSLTFHQRRRPMFPFEPETGWAPTCGTL